MTSPKGPSPRDKSRKITYTYEAGVIRGKMPLYPIHGHSPSRKLENPQSSHSPENPYRGERREPFGPAPTGCVPPWRKKPSEEKIYVNSG